MARSLPDAPKWDEPKPAGKQITLHLKTITPMFGGGFEPRETDPISPVRAAAIRGHLRFWWRALYGATFENAEQLFAAEEKLWGSAEKPGRVIVAVRLVRRGDERKCAHYERRPNGLFGAIPRFEPEWPPYALQPFQGELGAGKKTVKTEPSTALLGCEFELTLVTRNEADLEPVQNAVNAWVAYGGLGARTRRGCGSIACDTANGLFFPSPIDVKARHVTVLHGAQVILGAPESDAIRAWRKAVDTYRDFRQGVGVARAPGSASSAGGPPNRPGRSWWPEPDSIRRITGRHAAQHKPIHPVQEGFPRADLGLPIIFHFKDHNQHGSEFGPNDPADATLSGPAEGRERFASPVITKAVAENGRYRPLVLILNAPHVWQLGNLRLSAEKSATISQSQIELSPGERKQIRPLGGLPVREALAHFVASRWHVNPEVLP